MDKRLKSCSMSRTDYEQKMLAKKTRLAALAWLAQQFPKAFDNSNTIRPLKRGIMEDILQYADMAGQAGISKSKLREAVVVFTRRLDYLLAMKAQEMRVDLNGKPTEPVTDNEVRYAQERIQAFKDYWENKRPSSKSRSSTHGLHSKHTPTDEKVVTPSHHPQTTIFVKHKKDKLTPQPVEQSPRKKGKLTLK